LHQFILLSQVDGRTQNVTSLLGSGFLGRLLNEIEFVLGFVDQVSSDLKLDAKTKV